MSTREPQPSPKTCASVSSLACADGVRITPKPADQIKPPPPSAPPSTRTETRIPESIREMEYIAVSKLKEGDVVVVKTATHLSMEATHRMRETLADAFGSKVKILVIEGDITLDIIKQEPT